MIMIKKTVKKNFVICLWKPMLENIKIMRKIMIKLKILRKKL